MRPRLRKKSKAEGARIKSVVYRDIRSYFCYSGNQNVGVLECWSNGVLALKAEIDLILALLPLVMRGPTMVYIFSILFLYPV